MATTVTLKPNAIDISGSTSGTTTLQATAVAGTTTLTLPAATDTLVGKATTDTLTNKTLTGAVMNGTLGATTPSTVEATSISYTTTLTGGTGVVAIGTSQIYKDASGNVGIGATPATILDVYKASGNPYFRVYTGTGSVQGYMQALDSTYVKMGSLSSHDLGLVTGGTEAVRITTGGNVGIGTTSPNASAILDAQSTTKGVRMPNMTTTQKNAISSPAAGLMVFDTTLAKLCVYSGSAWQTITSV